MGRVAKYRKTKDTSQLYGVKVDPKKDLPLTQNDKSVPARWRMIQELQQKHEQLKIKKSIEKPKRNKDEKPKVNIAKLEMREGENFYGFAKRVEAVKRQQLLQIPDIKIPRVNEEKVKERFKKLKEKRKEKRAKRLNQTSMTNKKKDREDNGVDDKSNEIQENYIKEFQGVETIPFGATNERPPTLPPPKLKKETKDDLKPSLNKAKKEDFIILRDQVISSYKLFKKRKAQNEDKETTTTPDDFVGNL
eukprot:TRINITY_DN10435_c0_g1_i1.p1 TRINITY_DN10435_c0_g1~~TRINITY_DN10435_c0_g1_i1.p1  ORF type:complete len:248 (-),score=61.76 TRINITY_DN10435_c0_g1_i1:295-1038(-)